MKRYTKPKRHKLAGARRRTEQVDCRNTYVASRFNFATVMLVLAVIFLVIRVIKIQYLDADMWTNEANKRSLRQQKVLYARGEILDRDGKLLAVSVPMYVVVFDPKVIIESDTLNSKSSYWQALAKAMDIPYEEVVKEIRRNPKSRFLYLNRQFLSEKMADYVRKLHLEGVVLQRSARRFYPQGEVAAQLLGYTDVDGNGIGGVEKSFDKRLQGKLGKNIYRKDVKGNIIEDIDYKDKVDGENLTLSIDSKIQAMMYETVDQAVKLNKAKSGSAVLVDIKTGEILGMVTAPSYNPNNRKNLIIENTRNRIITDIFEPGSTIKPFVVLTALEHGYVKRNEIINTGKLVLDGFSVNDVSPRDMQSLDDILRNSSNRGVSRLALRMPENLLRQTYKSIGFGEPTKLGLIGEHAGVLKMQPPDGRRNWSKIEQATISYGYGLSVTPLQLVRAYMVLGSFGIYRPLTILKTDTTVDGVRVFPQYVTKEVVNMLEGVAIKNKRALVKGYSVGIKTGTAKKTKGRKKGYENKYLAYTAGIAPLSNPRFALVVMIDEPSTPNYYGGAVAAPLFSSIMGYALREMKVPQDREVKDYS